MLQLKHKFVQKKENIKMFQVQQVIQDHLQRNQMLHFLLLNKVYEMVRLEELEDMNIDKVIFLDNFS